MCNTRVERGHRYHQSASSVEYRVILLSGQRTRPQQTDGTASGDARRAWGEFRPV